MTMAQMMRNVSHKSAVTDVASTPDQNFLFEVINRGARELLRNTHCYVLQSTLALTTGTSQYDLESSITGASNGILKILEWSDESGNRTPFAISPAADILHLRSIGYQGATRRFALLGSNMLIVQPTPSENASIIVFYVPDFAEMASTADIIENITNIKGEYQRAIEMWALMEAAEKTHAFDAADRYEKKFEQECAKIRQAGRELAGRYAPASRVGYPGVPIARGPNDQYPSV